MDVKKYGSTSYAAGVSPEGSIYGLTEDVMSRVFDCYVIEARPHSQITQKLS